MIEEGRDLSFLLDRPMSSEDLEYEHRMDISGSVYTRMHELGMTQKDLASKMGVDQSSVSKIISGKQNITLKTLSKLENALDFRLDAGFAYVAPSCLETACISTEIEASGNAGNLSCHLSAQSHANNYVATTSCLSPIDGGVAA